MMMTATKKDLYSEVVEITQDFLGPASEKFISRQVAAHLNKQPEDLREEDLEELVKWIKIAIALLTEDGKTVDSYTASVLKLAKQQAH